MYFIITYIYVNSNNNKHIYDESWRIAFVHLQHWLYAYLQNGLLANTVLP